QKQPEDALEKGLEVNDFTKFLNMKLFNHRGVLLNKERGELLAHKYLNFNGNGMHEMSDMPRFQIREGDFRKAGEGITTTAPHIVKNIAFYPSGERPTVDPATNKYEVYIKFYDPPHYNITKFVGVGEKRKKVFVRLGRLDEEGFLYEEKDHYQIIFEDNQPRKGEEVRVTYLPKDYVISGGCDATPHNWKLFVTFYDKKHTSAEPSGQISNYQGQPQQREVTIRVRCKPPHEADLPACLTGNVTERCECGID
ncbi:unnamed protein product, partial [marine sediment metagenome]